MTVYGLLDRPLHVTDAAGLDDLTALLHDETCSVDDAVWNEKAKTLLLPVRRQFHGGEEVEVSRTSDGVTYEKSWMRTEVLIRNVTAWEKVDDQGIGDYSFNEWSFASPTIQIDYCEALVMLVTVDGLDVTATDLRFGGKSRIVRSIGGGSESSSSHIY